MFGIEQQLARWSAPLLSALSGGTAPAGFLDRWAGAWDRAARLVAGPPVLAGFDAGRFGDWPGLGLLAALVSLLPVSGAATEPVPGPRPRPPGPPLRERRRPGVPDTGSAHPTLPAAAPVGAVRGPRPWPPGRWAAGEPATSAAAGAAPAVAPGPAAPGPLTPGPAAPERRPVSPALLARLAGAATTAAAPDAPTRRARNRAWPGAPGSWRGLVELGVPEAPAAAARLVDLITRAPRLASAGLVAGPAGPGHAAAVEAELSRQFAEAVADPPAAEEVLRLVLTQAVASSGAAAATGLDHTGAAVTPPDAEPRERQPGGPPGTATRPAGPVRPGAATGSAALPPRTRRPAPHDAGAMLLRRLVADWPGPVGRAGADGLGLAGLPEAAATTQNTFNVTVHMTGGAADDAELAERLTRILAEQARRHGIDVH
jgi:hypothetical protein